MLLAKNHSNAFEYVKVTYRILRVLGFVLDMRKNDVFAAYRKTV